MDIIEYTGGGMASRYYVDGERVSQGRAETLKMFGRLGGKMDSLWTKGRTLPNGETRWAHGCSVR